LLQVGICGLSEAAHALEVAAAAERISVNPGEHRPKVRRLFTILSPETGKGLAKWLDELLLIVC
jgi:hypothetical protein